MVYIDEVEVDQEGIAEIMLDESSIAQVARKCCRSAIISCSQKWCRYSYALNALLLV